MRPSRNFSLPLAILIILFGQLLLVFIPPASAGSHSDPCAVNGGQCDEWDHNDDQTQNAQTWIESYYDFQMVDTGSVELTMYWAIHEFNRAAIELPALDIGSGSVQSRDGIPIDLIRNFIEEKPGGAGTPTVGDLMLGEVDDIVTSMLQSGFGANTSSSVDFTDSFYLDDQLVSCSSLSTNDAIVEGASTDDAFNPPLCVRVDAEVSLTADSFNLMPGIDVERAYQGLLTMGAELTTGFEVMSPPGHDSTYAISPPSYARVSDAQPNHATPDPQRGLWYLDNKDGIEGGDDDELAVSLTIGRATGGATEPVSIDTATEKGIDISVTLDLTDETSAQLNVDIAIHYIDAATMTSWGIDLVETSENAAIPWVTSDGIRLAYANGMVDPNLFIDQFPIEAIAEGINAIVPDGNPVSMGSLSLLSSNSTGGLNFTHNVDAPNTCSETSTPAAPLLYCIEGPTAMDSTHPLYLQASSNAFPFSLLDMLTDQLNFSEQGGFDMSVLTSDDVRAVMNAGLNAEFDMGTDFVSSMIPADVPPTELAIIIELPQVPTPWIANGDGSNSIVLSDRLVLPDQTLLSFTGPNPWDWRHPILNSDGDEVCRADQKTCVSMTLDIDFSDFSIHEWSQSASITLSARASLDIYRLEVPSSVTDAIDFGNNSVEFDVIPADLMRLLIDIGGRMNPPMSTTVDLSTGSEELVFSRDGINDFAEMISASLSERIQSTSSEDPNFQIDLSAFGVDVKWGDLSAPDAGAITDSKPISAIIEIPETVFTIAVDMEKQTGSLTASTIARSPVVQAFLGLSNELSVARGDGGVYIDDGGKPFVQTIDSPEISTSDSSMEPLTTLRLTLPKGLEFAEFSSTSGNHNLETTDEGRQRLIYTMPLSGDAEEISFSFKITWGFIFGEIWAYIVVPILLIGYLVYRRKQKKKRRGEKKQKRRISREEAVFEKEHIDFSDDDFMSGNLMGAGQPAKPKAPAPKPTYQKTQPSLPASPHGGKKGETFDDLLGLK